jgi:hypothetical protein
MNENFWTCRICGKAEPIAEGDADPGQRDDLDDRIHGRCIDGMIRFFDRPAAALGRRTLADVLEEVCRPHLRASIGSSSFSRRMERAEAELVRAMRRVDRPVCYTAPDRDEDDPGLSFFLADWTPEDGLFHFLADLDEVLAASDRVNAHEFDPDGRPLSG